MDVDDHGDVLVVRLDPDDRVLSSLETIRDEHGLDGAFFTGIGAADVIRLGHYDVEEQEYNEERFMGQFEITNFTGNIGPDKIHAHVTAGRDDFSTLSGHCAGIRVSGTFELIIWRTPATLTHRPDTSTGLDVFDL